MTETATMTVTGFERFGPIVVRTRTYKDSMFIIPALQDQYLNETLRELGIEDINAGDQLRYNALLVAIAKAVILEPIGFVASLLDSTNSEDFRFFGVFAEEYSAWMDGKIEAAQSKKSGTEQTETGSESVSSSEATIDSSQLSLVG